MIRPFFVFGLTEFLSLLLFKFAGIVTATVCGAVSLISYIFLLIYKKDFKFKIYLKGIFSFILISSILFSGNFFYAQRPAEALADNEKHNVCGVVFAETEQSYGKYRYYIKLDSADGNDSGVKLRFVSSDFYNLKVGNKVKIDDAVIYPLSRYSGDGVFAGAYSDKTINITDRDENSIYSFISSVRSYITDTLSNNLPNETAALCTALLTGDTHNLPENDISSFRYSGVSHLFAVSGLHLTIWTSVLFLILDKVLVNKRRTKAVISALFIIFFTFLTGFTRSVMRAGVMLLLFNTGAFLNRKTDSINSLFFALTAILSFDTNLCCDVSLLMSFFSCLGLITFAPKLGNLLGRYIRNIRFTPVRYLLNFINSSVCVSLSATLFTVIISSIFFRQFSAAGPLANVIAVPLAESVMLCSALGLILSLINAQSVIFIITNALSRALLFVTDRLSVISECSVNMSDNVFLYIAAAVFVCFLIVLFIFYSNEKAVRNAGITALAAIFLCSVCSQFSAVNDSSITVSATGECECVVLKFKGGNAAIVSSADIKTSEYSPISSILSKRETDVLILDSESSSSSAYLSAAISQIRARYAVISPSINDPGLIRNAEEINKNDRCRVNIGDGASLYYTKNQDGSYVYFKSDAYTCLSLLGENDAGCPKSADVLIVRSYIPDYIDLSNFGCIIVVSPADKTLAGQRAKNVYYTEYNDTVTYRNGEIE